MSGLRSFKESIYYIGFCNGAYCPACKQYPTAKNLKWKCFCYPEAERLLKEYRQSLVSARRTERKQQRKLKKIVNEKYYFCKSCKRDVLIENYGKGHFCKQCNTFRRGLALLNKKKKAFEYKGGKCSDCGFRSEYIFLFDFHHLDPCEKDADWTYLKKLQLKNMQKELDKCVLLCSSCHRLRHWKDNFDRLVEFGKEHPLAKKSGHGG